MSGRVRVLALASVALVVAMARPARAHDSSPGVLALAPRDDGRFLVGWSPPVDTRLPASHRVAPVFPAHCREEGGVLDCGARGLEGELGVEGLEGTRLRVVLVVEREGEGAPPFEAMLDAGTPRVALSAPSSGVGAWIALGLEHVLFGLDHLAFLAGLLLVSRIDRRLLGTVTAFTLAHSLTLALAVLDVVRVHPPLVEALIALSVLLVAREALRKAPSSVHRAPWAVAGFFGLVHGLGLAGALRETALPSHALVPALFGFNVGVELGQLAFVGAALLVVRAVRGRRWEPRARTTLVYAIGIASAYWLVVRAAQLG
ncbi:MAG: HupE/UreJ family protein [Sandaracinus sp.]